MKSILKAALILAVLCLSPIAISKDVIINPSDEALMEKWAKLGLTTQEQQWLLNNKIIRHGIIDHPLVAPFEFTDEFGNHHGLNSDYIKVISERLGIEFQVNLIATKGGQLINSLRRDEIDFVSFLPINPAREKLVNFSHPIIEVPIVFLGRQGSPLIHSIDYLRDERLVVVENSRPVIYLKAYMPNLELIYVKTKEDGIDLVKNNEADIFIHNAYSLVYDLKKNNIEGLEVIGTTPFHLPISFAVSDKMKPLLPIIKKALTDMSSVEKRLIFDKWINVNIEKSIDVQLVIKFIVVTVVVISLIVFVFIYINRRLASKVSERTLELRKLSRHMENLRENEKAKLAREIHDELGHHLTSLSIGIRQLKDSLSNKINLNKANDLLKTVKETTTMSKKIMTDLRPSILEDLGLVAAIEWLGIEFSKRHKIQCMVKAHEPSSAISEELTVAIFRITQESLTNITKHANATRVEVILTPQDNDLLLLISDNGRGLVKGWESKQSSYGLIGIKERVLGLDGNISIDSAPNKGVQLLIRLPILSNTELT